MAPSFIPHRRAAQGKRSIKDVPFVELFGGRVQGVVSSGSDLERVYVSWFEGGTGNYACSTNNNRPCGGLRGSPCKHIAGLVEAAVAQFGIEAVARVLGVPGAEDAYGLLRSATGTSVREPSGAVFSRFLDYLRYLELEPPQGELPDMAWFVTG